jgi:hypothetical protein
MEFFGINIIDLATNPVGAVGALATAIVSYKVYRVFDSVFRPVSYVGKLYDLADDIVLRVDNNIIDKIRNRHIKESTQVELIRILQDRKGKIDFLVESIRD